MGQNLIKYKEHQQMIYNILDNSLKNNTLSHAYLFSSNDKDYLLDFSLSFSKEIFCLSNAENSNNICNLIDIGEYPDIKIINPTGLVIKKEQILDLKEQFKTSSLYENKKVYIINGCEYLNDFSANSLLKFLEEPEKDIYAILLTSNINNVKETIKSRCQILHINNNSIEKSNDDEDNVLKYIKMYENKKIDAILFTNQFWFNIYDNKEKNDQAYQIMIDLYNNILNIKLGLMRTCNNYNELLELANKNTTQQLVNKINKIMEAKERNIKNCNIKLVMDKLIIDMED